MTRAIKIKTVLPYSTDQVWRALTDSKILASWLMENDLKPEPGRYFTFRMAPQKGWDGITHCQILELRDQQYIAYSYRGEATGEKALACAGIHSDAVHSVTKGIFAKLDTIVSFRLQPTCGGTILHLEQSGYKGIKLMIVSMIMKMGWRKQLMKRLPMTLQQLPGPLHDVTSGTR
jgi:uncharacterized protein YndB with AHSA1/START domain